MNTVEYDVAVMRWALSELASINRKLPADLRTLERVAEVRCPGDAALTRRRHQGVQREIRSLLASHRTFATAIDGALEALIRVDRQYNDGALVRELALAD